MKAYLPNDIKDKNRKIIFDIFMREPELAKIEVAARTAISTVTVNKIIDFFEEKGIVKINGDLRDGSGGMGRKRVIYKFNPNAYLTIGIQLIGGVVKATLINMYGEELGFVEADGTYKFHEEDFIVKLCEIHAQFKKEAKKVKGKILGIGIGIDGAINSRNKTIRMRSSGTEFEETFSYEEIVDTIKKALHMPVMLENDVEASAIAEYMNLEHDLVEKDDMLLISVGEGIGAALILNGKLHRGSNAGVGELEFACFDPDFVFRPSSLGWLEKKMNLDYLKRQFGFLPNQPERMGETERTAFVGYVAKYLALTIINTSCILNVPHIVLNGRTVRAMPEMIIEETKNYIRQYTGWEYEILYGARRHSTAIGAAVNSMREELEKVITEKGKSDIG